MTQTENAPSAEQIRAWLAAQPCPECEADHNVDHALIHKGPCNCLSCGGLGLAFEWASDPCVRTVRVGGRDVFLLCKGTEDCQCGGSGRVPKDVGLADLVRAVPHGAWSFVAGEDDWFCTLTIYNPNGDEEADPQVFKGADPDETLAALRAIAAQAGMPQGKDA